MQLDKKSFKKIALIVAGGILLNWLVHNLSMVSQIFRTAWGLFLPIIIGLVLAFMLNIPMTFLERHLFRGKGGRLRRPVSFVLTLVLVLAVLVLIVFLIIPELAKTIANIVGAMPGYITRLQAWMAPYAAYIPQLEEFVQDLRIDWNSALVSVSEIIRNGAFNFINSAFGVASSIISGTTSFFLGVVFAVYLLLDKEHLVAQTKGVMQAYIPEKRYTSLSGVLSLVNRTFSRFVAGQCSEAVVVMLLFFVVLSVGGFDYALLLSVLTGIMSFVPMIGAFVSLAIGALLILASQGFWRFIAFIIVYLITQQVDGNLIYPRIIGNSINLSPIWVLLAVLVGGGVMGLFGMLFFIPLFSVLYTLLQERTLRRLYKKGLATPPPGSPPFSSAPRQGFWAGIFDASPKQGAGTDGAEADLPKADDGKPGAEG